MINIRLTVDLERTTKIVPKTETPKSFLLSQGVNIETRTLSIDGRVVELKEMGMTFEELNLGDECLMSTVTKSENR